MLPLQGQSGPRNDGNKEILHIPPGSSITGTSSAAYLVLYQDTRWGSLTPLQRSSRCILQPQTTWQIYIYIRSPWGLSILAEKYTAAARISKSLRTN